VIRLSPAWLPPAAFGVAFLLSAGTPSARPDAPPAASLAPLPAVITPVAQTSAVVTPQKVVVVKKVRHRPRHRPAKRVHRRPVTRAAAPPVAVTRAATAPVATTPAAVPTPPPAPVATPAPAKKPARAKDFDSSGGFDSQG
jgi:hypothetical protein